MARGSGPGWAAISAAGPSSFGHIARLAGRPERAVNARLRSQWAEFRDTLVARGVRPFFGRLTAHALVASVERRTPSPTAWSARVPQLVGRRIA